MSNFDNRNRGSIWKNDKKREGKQDPDFTGSLNVEGVEYWVSAWKRKEGAADNAPALSFTVKPKEANKRTMPKADMRDVQERPRGARPSQREAMDDEIPW